MGRKDESNHCEWSVKVSQHPNRQTIQPWKKDKKQKKVIEPKASSEEIDKDVAELIEMMSDPRCGIF